jgi:malate/lactate dehydrogenase
LLGNSGVERILAVPLDENEAKALASSVKSLKEIIDQYNDK